MGSVTPSYVENVVAEGVPGRSPGGWEVDFSAKKGGSWQASPQEGPAGRQAKDMGDVFGALEKHLPALWGRRFDQKLMSGAFCKTVSGF